MKKKTFLFLAAAAVLLVVSCNEAALVPVINAPIRDEMALDRIVLRINQEGIKTSISSTGLVQVADESTARRMRTILICEDLIPTNIDPWAIFDRERWTITDFERNVNFRRAQTQMITDHIKAIDDVDDANVTIVFPERELFRSDQNPVTACVIITPKPGSDITTNRKKIEGIQKLLKIAIEGMRDDNIVITDQSGVILNDFTGMAAIERKLIQPIENNEETNDDEKFLPQIIKPRTPGLAYDDSEIIYDLLYRYDGYWSMRFGEYFRLADNIPIPQEPPAFKYMSELYGRMMETDDNRNKDVMENKLIQQLEAKYRAMLLHELQQVFSPDRVRDLHIKIDMDIFNLTQGERNPNIDRITVSVNIDGTWKWKYDEKGNPVILPDGSIEREYTPVPLEQLRIATALIQDIIGYNSARGDSVTVMNIPFDRTREFNEEDAAYFVKKQKKQIQMTVIILSGLTLLLISFIIFRRIAGHVKAPVAGIVWIINRGCGILR